MTRPPYHGDGPIEALGLVHVSGGDQHADAGPIGADAVDDDQNCWRERGSTPVVGSSRMRRSGSWIRRRRGRPSASCRRRARRRGGRGRPQSRGVEQAEDAAARWESGTPNSLAKKSMFSKTLSSRYRFLPDPGHEGDAWAACRCPGRLRSCRRPGRGLQPAPTLLRAAIRPMSVDLPDAVRPTRSTMTPAGMSRSRASTARGFSDKCERRRGTDSTGSVSRAGGVEMPTLGEAIASPSSRSGGRRSRSWGSSAWPSGYAGGRRFSGRRGGRGPSPGKGRSSCSGQAAELFEPDVADAEYAES